MYEVEYLKEILKDQLRRHSDFQAEDYYKLVHQVSCGGDHFVKNEVYAKRILLREWKTLDKVQRGESLLEMIDPMGEIIRVNLRVYKKTGREPDKLLDVFLHSAAQYRKSSDRLRCYWQEIRALAENGSIPISDTQLTCFWKKVEEKNFPAIHHSKIYAEKNCPAYRVVLKHLWYEMMQ